MSKPQLPKIDNASSYYEFLAQLPTAIGVANFDTGIITYTNPLAEELFAREGAQLIGQHQSILHPPEKQGDNTFQEHARLLEQEGRIEGLDNIILRPDGTEIHVSITSNLVLIEGERHMVGVINNIEKRFQAQQALQQKSAEFSALFDNSQVGIMLLKGYRILHLANQHLAEMLGYDSVEEMIGISIRELHLSQANFENFGAENYDTLAQHRNLHIEYQLRKKNGEPIWCRLSGTAVDDNSPAELSKGVIWVVDDISDIKAAQETIQHERDLFKRGPTVVIQWRPENNWPVDFVSENIKDVLGYQDSELLDNAQYSYYDLIHPDDRQRVTQEAQQHFQNRDNSFEQTYQIRTKSGQYSTIYEFNQVLYHDNGEVKSWYGYLLDMTDYLQTKEINNLLLNGTNEGIFGIDENGITTFVNPAATKLLGYSEQELIGRQNHALIHHSTETGENIPEHTCRMMKPLETSTEELVSDEILWRKDGSYFPVEYRSSPILQNDKVIGTVVTFRDISNRKAQERKIQHLAFHDELTGLPNRRLFNDRLVEELKYEKRVAQRAVLMMLDVDHFKDINDTFGHPIGDGLLKAISDRITRLLRESDTFARLGGDEFGILLLDDSGGMETVLIADRILDSFKTPFEIQGLQIPTSTSIGIAFCDPSFSSEEIVSQADIALYQAKYSGRNNYIFYESNMASQVKQEVQLLNELNSAIAKQAFQIYYQPQIDIRHGNKVIGLEALIRWFPEDEETKKMSSPGIFIPIAESRGLIGEITKWQIGQLVEDLKYLQDCGFKGRVSINLSGEILNHIENLVEVLEVIEHNKLDFNQLEFEITETAYSKMSEAVQAVLRSAQDNGLLLSIDDFGTGYSSLISLRQFDASHLKIDKAFIDHLHANKADFSIVTATILMAHGLGKTVIAEGVETAEQLAVLKRIKCDIIQGYYFAKPMPLTEVCDYLNHSNLT